jgi:hypothetical protein
MMMPIHITENSTPLKKANSTERGGRKVSGLKPKSQGSGTAEVERKGSPTTVQQTAKPMMVGGVDSNQPEEVRSSNTLLLMKTGIG